MSATYRVVLNGTMPGQAVDRVAQEISALFKLPIEQSKALLARPGVRIKKGVDLQTAVKYQAALEMRGCACVVEPEVVSKDDLTIDPSAMQPTDLRAHREDPVRRSEVEQPSTPADYSREKAYYARRFEAFNANDGRFRPTWNWFSLLFGPLWYLYKGLWAKGALMVVITFALAGVPAVFFWPYAAIAGNYDYYLWRCRGSQLWANAGPLEHARRLRAHDDRAGPLAARVTTTQRPSLVSVAGRIALLSATALGLVIVILAVRHFMQENPPPQGASYPSAGNSGMNSLERAVLVGRSTKQQFAEFRNQGGLEKESSWRGFRVLAIETVYEPSSGTLGILQLKLMKSFPRMKIASFNEVSQSLTPECGTGWTQNDTQQIAGYHMAENGRIACAIEESSDGQVAVHILVRSAPVVPSASAGTSMPEIRTPDEPASSDPHRSPTSAGIPTAEEVAAERSANNVEPTPGDEAPARHIAEDEDCTRAKARCYEKRSDAMRAACISALQSIRQCGP